MSALPPWFLCPSRFTPEFFGFLLIPLHGLTQKEALQGSAGVPGPDELDPLLAAGEIPDAIQKTWGRIPENNLGLIFDRNEILERSLSYERALVNDANPVTDFLNLFEQVRAKEDGEAPIL